MDQMACRWIDAHDVEFAVVSALLPGPNKHRLADEIAAVLKPFGCQLLKMIHVSPRPSPAAPTTARSALAGHNGLREKLSAMGTVHKFKKRPKNAGQFKGRPPQPFNSGKRRSTRRWRWRYKEAKLALLGVSVGG